MSSFKISFKYILITYTVLSLFAVSTSFSLLCWQTHTYGFRLVSNSRILRIYLFVIYHCIYGSSECCRAGCLYLNAVLITLFFYLHVSSMCSIYLLCILIRVIWHGSTLKPTVDTVLYTMLQQLISTLPEVGLMLSLYQK